MKNPTDWWAVLIVGVQFPYTFMLGPDNLPRLFVREADAKKAAATVKDGRPVRVFLTTKGATP